VRAYPVLALCGFVVCADAARSQASRLESISPLRFPTVEHSRFSGNAEYVYDSSTNTTLARFQVSLSSYNILYDLLGADSPEIQRLVIEYSFAGHRLTAPPESVLVGFSRRETRPMQADDEYPLGGSGSARAELTFNDTDRTTYRLRTRRKTEHHRIYVGNDERGVTRAGGDPIIREGVVGLQNRRVLDVVETEEWAETWLPIREFLFLVTARKIEGKVNNIDLRLSDRAFHGLREFASHMDPLAPPDE